MLSNSQGPEPALSHTHPHLSVMLKLMNKNLRNLCSHLRWPIRCRSKCKLVVVKRFGKAIPKPQNEPTTEPAATPKPIRIATFNAALFSMAPAVPVTDNIITASATFDDDKPNDRPRSILKQENNNLNGKHDKSKLRVSINLPDNEISLLRNGQRSFSEHEREGACCWQKRRTVVEVLRELNADVLGLQDVKAEEENGMRPLSDLARALGMNYVFAESWAPQYGNAVFSKWPIKRCTVQKVFDHTDFSSASTEDYVRV